MEKLNMGYIVDEVMLSAKEGITTVCFMDEDYAVDMVSLANSLGYQCEVLDDVLYVSQYKVCLCITNDYIAVTQDTKNNIIDLLNRYLHEVDYATVLNGDTVSVEVRYKKDYNMKIFDFTLV